MSRQHRRQGDPATVLEGQHEPTGGVVVERSRRYAVMPWRRGQARGADRRCRDAFSERALAERAGGFTGDDEFAPAGGAEARLCGQPLSAQRATRREYKVDGRSQGLR